MASTRKKPAAKKAPAKKGGRPKGTTRFTEDQVAAALRATGGIKQHAAIWLAKTYNRPCARTTVVQYIDKSPRLQKLLDEIEEVRLDFSEDMLFQHIENSSERSLHFYLATKGKRRGYTRRDEITGPEGAPLVPEPVSRYAELSTSEIREQLAELQRTADKLAAATTKPA